MKNKIVIWGEDQKLEKVLLALELKERDNKVMVYVFPQDVATEDFYNLMISDWKDDKEVAFPEGYKVIERPLSMSDSLLPDDIKTDKSDILRAAQAEWHFVVLSSKLYEIYKTELDEIKERVEQLTSYSDGLWGEMKDFWSKVQTKVNERDLFRDHAGLLKERTNTLFEKMKTLRKDMKKELDEKSGEIAEALVNQLNEIQDKIDKGLALNPIFEELKSIQDKFFGESLARKDKDQVWGKIDSMFKQIKEKRYGDKPVKNQKGSQTGRLKARYDGLLNAIQRMEGSINFDKKDIDFQNSKINTSEGQLEMQIRKAKLVMIEERIKSKQFKLDDMLKTKVEVEGMMEKEAQREKDREKDAEKEKVKAEVKQKIAASIETSQHEVPSDIAEKLEKAAGEINQAKIKPKSANIEATEESSVVDAPDTIEQLADKAEVLVDEGIDKVSDIAEDVVDTVSAVAQVLGDKIDDFIEKLKGEEE